VAVSAGAACHSDSITVSPILQAMHVPLDYAMGTLRVSGGWGLTPQQVMEAGVTVAAAALPLLPSVSGSAPVCQMVEEGQEVKLTHFTQGQGCACKLRPLALERVLRKVSASSVHDPNILVGNNTADDACVYDMGDGTAVVATVDFFTPVCDDPYTFGMISASNALSDVYAMASTPLFALAIVGFPSTRLPESALAQILQGGTDKCQEAGIAVVGGHTVESPEPLFGLCVFGRAPLSDIRRNVGVSQGDWLVLTKPLGVGVLSTAIKKGLTEGGASQTACDTMAALNLYAAEVVAGPQHKDNVTALTDVTGFGLSGHLLEMLGEAEEGSDTLAAVLHWDSLPLIPEAVTALRTYGNQVVPGGTDNNREWLRQRGAAPALCPSGPLCPTHTEILAVDAQTSGGLLIAVKGKAEADALVSALSAKEGVPCACVIGRVVSKAEADTLHKGDSTRLVLAHSSVAGEV
ncbi:selenophosphate synthetase, class I, partial [Kipferlia bialata]